METCWELCSSCSLILPVAVFDVTSLSNLQGDVFTLVNLVAITSISSPYHDFWIRQLWRVTALFSSYCSCPKIAKQDDSEPTKGVPGLPLACRSCQWWDNVSLIGGNGHMINLHWATLCLCVSGCHWWTGVQVSKFQGDGTVVYSNLCVVYCGYVICGFWSWLDF